MLRARSRALFRLLLLPPPLDRPCDLLVLLGHLREAVLPQALCASPVPFRRLLAVLLANRPRSTSAASLEEVAQSTCRAGMESVRRWLGGAAQRFHQSTPSRGVKTPASAAGPPSL